MTKEDTPLPLLSDDPTPIAFKHYDILVGSDGNSIQALTEGIGPTGNRVTKSENGSTLYGQLLSRDAKIKSLEADVFAWRNLADGPTARRQFPDGRVPGNSEEAAKGWMELYNEQDAKIAHLQSLNELKYNEGFTEASRIAGAKIKSLENEVTRLRGATNFETVPKEAYDRLEVLVQELVDALATCQTFGGKTWSEDTYDEVAVAAALSSAKALDISPKTTT